MQYPYFGRFREEITQHDSLTHIQLCRVPLCEEEQFQLTKHLVVRFGASERFKKDELLPPKTNCSEQFAARVQAD